MDDPTREIISENYRRDLALDCWFYIERYRAYDLILQSHMNRFTLPTGILQSLLALKIPEELVRLDELKDNLKGPMAYSAGAYARSYLNRIIAMDTLHGAAAHQLARYKDAMIAPVPQD